MIKVEKVFNDGLRTDATLQELLEEVAGEFCENYCKYPDSWDEEKEGCELSESDICANCPITKLI